MELIEQNKEYISSITYQFGVWVISGWSKKENVGSESLTWEDINTRATETTEVRNKDLSQAVQDFIANINA